MLDCVAALPQNIRTNTIYCHSVGVMLVLTQYRLIQSIAYSRKQFQWYRKMKNGNNDWNISSSRKLNSVTWDFARRYISILRDARNFGTVLSSKTRQIWIELNGHQFNPWRIQLHGWLVTVNCLLMLEPMLFIEVGGTHYKTSLQQIPLVFIWLYGIKGMTEHVWKMLMITHVNHKIITATDMWCWEYHVQVKRSLQICQAKWLTQY